VKGCFVRTLDDLIVIKTVLHDAKVRADSDKVNNVLVQGNVLWNEVGHALSIGAEVQADVSNVAFMDNDVIHDLGREWPLRIFLSGSGTVSTTHFQDIRIDSTGNQYATGGRSNLIDLSVVDTSWRAEADRSRPLGKIQVTIFRNIQSVLSKPGTPSLKAQIDLVGASENSDVEGVKFDNIVINGQPLSKSNSIVVQRFATKVTGLP
jgi:polygalacturonase